MLRLHDDIQVVGLASSGEEAIALFRKTRPDVTLMDLRLPAMSGLEAIRTIVREFSDARIVVLTTYDGDEDIARALKAGAATYLIKDTLPSDLVHVIRDVHNGGSPIRPDVQARLQERSQGPTLTAREIEVVELMAKGMRNKEIAAVLGLSEDTVRIHVKHVLAKLDVHDRSAAVVVALRRGIVHT
jgi:two-component system NarL family response regulator